MASPIISCRNLCKSYGPLKALDNVTLDLEPGAIGLLGPNGAGKSTLMKCLLQLQDFDSGEARLLGDDVKARGADLRERVGYVCEHEAHIGGLVASEYVAYSARLSGIPFEAARQRSHELLDFVGMGAERYQKVEGLPTGLKQRLKLAQALVHDPKLVILDEPTNGLDPRGREQTLALIRSLWKDLRISVILSSHLLQDVAKVCESIVVINKGRIVVHDTMENLSRRESPQLEVLVANKRHVFLQETASWNPELLPSGRVRLHLPDGDTAPLLSLLDRLGIYPLEMIPSPTNLESLFTGLSKVPGERP
ncbi:MAG: ABC transporter ATP-binding protein [Planctomycetota bacterium]